MIGIVDYGMGNLRSVFNAISLFGATVKVIDDPAEIKKASRIVLPGVGGFRDAVANLRKCGLTEALEEACLQRRIPLLGICLGMQVLASKGYEHGESDGFGWIKGKVTQLDVTSRGLKIPHVGWNNARFEREHPLFKGIKNNFDFYFCHSFKFECEDEVNVAARCTYGEDFCCAIASENLFCTQFHPEKSQEGGLKLLENFIDWKP